MERTRGAKVTVTQTVTDTDADGVSEFVSDVVVQSRRMATWRQMTIDGAKLAAKVFTGTLRAANVAANGFAAELNRLFGPPSGSVTTLNNGDGTAGAPDETQRVAVEANGGTFTLSLQDPAINGGIGRRPPARSAYNATAPRSRRRWSRSSGSTRSP